MDTHSTYRCPRRRGEIENNRNLEEIMDKNFPNLSKEIDIQIQEILSLNKMNPKKPTPKQIIIKMSKLKTEREY